MGREFCRTNQGMHSQAMFSEISKVNPSFFTLDWDLKLWWHCILDLWLKIMQRENEINVRRRKASSHLMPKHLVCTFSNPCILQPNCLFYIDVNTGFTKGWKWWNSCLETTFCENERMRILVLRQVDSSNLVKIIMALELKQTKVGGSRDTALFSKSGQSGLSHMKR